MSKDKKISGIESVIAKDMIIKGEITFEKGLQLDGVVDGALSGSDVVMGKTGVLKGDANLHNFVCHGRVEGTIVAERVELSDTASISGALSARELNMASKSLFEGTMQVVREFDRHNVSQSGTHQVKGEDIEDRMEPEEKVVLPQPTSTEAPPEEETEDSILNTLISTIKGGSQLVVVSANDSQQLHELCTSARDKLHDRYLCMHIENPAGSFRELLVRIAGECNLELDDYGDQDRVLQSLGNHMKKQADDEKVAILMIENGEKMYPASLERIIQRLAGQRGTEMALVQLILFGDTTLKDMMSSEDSSLLIREPDCIIEL